MTSLFRPESLEGRQQAWLGSIQLIRPISLPLLTTLSVVVALAVAIFLCVAQYTRKASVTGVLVPDSGVLRVLAPQAGTVIESHAVEGGSVRQGDVLFVLAVGRNSEQGDTQAAVQQSLAARQRSLQASARQRLDLLHAQRAGLDRQTADLQREITQVDAEAALQRERLALAQQALARLESLLADNFISSAQVQAKSEEVLGIRAQMVALERQRASKLREIGVIDAQRRELPLQAQAATGAIERDIAELAQASAEVAAQQRVVVRAPQDGVLTAVTAQVGQSAAPDASLVSLLPAHAQLQAQLYAPSSAVGFVRGSQTVLLRYQAFPYQKFGHHAGRVLAVSRTPLQPHELTGLALPAHNEPLYRITVALEAQAVQAYGQAQALVPGMQLDADVLLDRRRLIEWIFEPLIGMAGRV